MNDPEGISRKILFAWSSGKDSAWALYCLQQTPGIEVVGLLTTVNARFDRIAMHAVRRQLLEQQAAALAIAPWIVEIPHPCSNEQYEEIMGHAVREARAEGISAIAFGDLYLAEVREYRERQLAGTELTPLFPLWLQETGALARTIQSAGFRARVTCIDPRVLDRSFAGREWDAAFLNDLPNGIDPCGENGEFHTFVYDGPNFSRPVAVTSGETVERDGFLFTDLLPA